MNRIDRKFKELRAAGRKAFIPFLTVGYPTLGHPPLEATRAFVLALEKAGADIVELGVPFSDPVADGPIIQRSSQAALRDGMTLKKVLSLVAKLREETQIPLVAMTYYNPILHYRPSLFARDAVSAGLDAVIIPDLPPEEELDFAKEARRRGLEIILFVSPATSSKRARLIANQAKGFIYFVSLTGVTGERRSLAKDLKARLRRLKKIAGATPVCAGFGFSHPDQVRIAAASCDGVIVGSALIRKMSQKRGTNLDVVVRDVARLARRLKGDI